MKKMMLDLCSGLGGQSEAFLNSYDVLRIDNNPLMKDVPRTVLMDVYDLQVFNISSHRINYVHAGPTCTDFSLAFNAPRSQAIHAKGFDDGSYYPHEGVRLVKKCKEIIDELNPQYWSIENVRGSIKYLKPILGEPRLIIGAFVYWGNFPLFEFDVSSIPTKAEKDKRWSPIRANIRACVPFKLSKAFFDAMDSQKTMFDY